MKNLVNVDALENVNLEKARAVYFDLAKEMLCTVTAYGIIIDVNNAFIQTTEYTINELKSTSLLQWIHPADQISVNDNLASLSNGQSIQFNCRLLFKNAGFQLLHLSATFNYECGSIILQIKELSKDADNILESITDGFLAVDKNWIITYWNQNAQLLLNKEKKKVLGESIWDCYPKEVGKGFYNHYHKAIKEQVPVHFEEYLAEMDKWFEVTAYPSGDGLAIYFRDVSDRVKYQQELIEVNKRMEYVLKANSGAIWDYSVDKQQTYVERNGFKKLFGHDVKNIEDAEWFLLIHPDDQQRLEMAFINAIKENKDIWSEEFRLKKSNGEYAYVLSRGYVLKDEQGRTFHIIGSFEDISKEKEIEKALLESEKNYKSLFSSSPIPIFIYDAETLQIIEANESTSKHYGYTKEEILNMTVLDFRPEYDHEKFRQFIKDLKVNRKPVSLIWKHLKRNGEEIDVEVATTTINYKNKEAVLAIIFDITDRLKLESKIADLKEAQQKSITQATINGQEKERAELGRELHDNIQQVLTATKLYLDMAEMNTDLRKEMIGKSKKHLLYCISEIRSISKALLPPSLDSVSLSESIEEIIESYHLTTKILFHFNSNPKIDKLSTDVQTSFYRIVQEQFNNIIKYADAENVWVDFGVKDGTISLKIEDDGNGFDTTKKRLGIGLTNMKNRVDLYEGNMKITSAPGVGCIINIEIPLEAKEDNMNNEVCHVFIAEDNEDDRDFIKGAFEEVAPQHQITFADNGMELMQILESLPKEVEPSLVILDYNMPMENGLETLKALQVTSRFKNVPKIIYSTSNNPYYKDQSLAASATAYLAKGLTKAEIIKDVQQMIQYIKK